jgi:ribosome-associated translation inhibitor RaiA
MNFDVTFRHCEKSTTLVGDITDRAEKLQKYFDRIIGCHVMVEAPHQRHAKGNSYQVRIDLKVPGKELVARNEIDINRSSEDPYFAVHEAFEVMKRELQDYVRALRGEVKRHENYETFETHEAYEPTVANA